MLKGLDRCLLSFIVWLIHMSFECRTKEATAYNTKRFFQCLSGKYECSAKFELTLTPLIR